MVLPRRPKRCGAPRSRFRSAVAVPVFTSGTCNFGKEKHSALRVLRTRWRTKAKYAVLMTSCTQPFARDRGADCVISADRGPVPSRDRAGKSRAVHRVEGGSSQQSRVGERAGMGDKPAQPLTVRGMETALTRLPPALRRCQCMGRSHMSRCCRCVRSLIPTGMQRATRL
jgi:hypothetical protein